MSKVLEKIITTIDQGWGEDEGVKFMAWRLMSPYCPDFDGEDCLKLYKHKKIDSDSCWYSDCPRLKKEDGS